MKYPYWLVLLLAIDRAAAAIFFNRADITVSSLCWIVRGGYQLDVYFWQRLLLRAIGAGLELVNPGHCANARLSDIKTAQSTLKELGAPP